MDAKTFYGRGQVAALHTRPETVLDDYYGLMRLCDYEQNLLKETDTLLKVNLSWRIWYPGSSTTPWQLDGVIRALLRDGYAGERILAVYDSTAGADARQGALSNRLGLVQEHYGIRDLPTNTGNVEWVRYAPKRPLAALDRISPDGIYLPKSFFGKNVLQLPTMKTDAITILAGAVKNGAGGLLDRDLYSAQADIHDLLVDLLQIQQEIHSGIFCVMDGTFAGEGPGPRALRPYLKNTILASADPVALDATAARMMGIDPLRIRFIRHAHERGLGVGNPKEIRIVGDSDIARENWHFEHDQDTLASWAQKEIAHGVLRSLPRSSLVAWDYAASNLYYNLYWYPFVGAHRAELMLNTAWGQKFLQYSEGKPFNPGADSKLPFTAVALGAAAGLAAVGLGAYYRSRRKRR